MLETYNQVPQDKPQVAKGDKSGEDYSRKKRVRDGMGKESVTEQGRAEESLGSLNGL